MVTVQHLCSCSLKAIFKTYLDVVHVAWDERAKLHKSQDKNKMRQSAQAQSTASAAEAAVPADDMDADGAMQVEAAQHVS